MASKEMEAGKRRRIVEQKRNRSNKEKKRRYLVRKERLVRDEE